MKWIIWAIVIFAVGYIVLSLAGMIFGGGFDP